MERIAVIETLENLAQSQGFYARLLKNLEEMQDADPDKYEEIMTQLEGCGDAVGMIMLIEG